MRRRLLLFAIASVALATAALAQSLAPSAADSQSAAFAGTVAMTVGVTYAPQRSVEVDATVQGLVTFTLSDGSTRTRIAYVGTTTLPYAVTSWSLPGSGAATVSGVFNMK